MSDTLVKTLRWPFSFSVVAVCLMSVYLLVGDPVCYLTMPKFTSFYSFRSMCNRPFVKIAVVERQTDHKQFLLRTGLNGKLNSSDLMKGCIVGCRLLVWFDQSGKYNMSGRSSVMFPERMFVDGPYFLAERQ